MVVGGCPTPCKKGGGLSGRGKCPGENPTLFSRYHTAQMCRAIKQRVVSKMLAKYCRHSLNGENWRKLIACISNPIPVPLRSAVVAAAAAWLGLHVCVMTTVCLIS